jgi:hypothetical protein
MRKAKFLGAFLLVCSTPSVFAASLTINFINQSGDAISELALTSKKSPEPPVQDNPELPEPPVQNILAAPIAAGDSSAVTIEAGDGECIFNLTFTFASGKVLERPDTDIC